MKMPPITPPASQIPGISNSQTDSGIRRGEIQTPCAPECLQMNRAYNSSGQIGGLDHERTAGKNRPPWPIWRDPESNESFRMIPKFIGESGYTSIDPEENTRVDELALVLSRATLPDVAGTAVVH
ncbi:hypothetical protein B0H17DRAFT_1149987 [Mycena rosella]|uniref:Uncharacterized protein n=1 Tax=Mycena rosella TaxID=1033263 RepID=A0AAD7BVS7_MYCRO|nr:hypothetical protein B0H17DRAFT_1149987 [Mycena rosella]